ALIIAEAIAAPIPLDQNSTSCSRATLAPLPPTLSLGADSPPVYDYVAQLPASATIVELPLGEPAFDIRYMFYSTSHWRRLVNGYSGGAPESYGFLTEALNDALTRPDRARDALSSPGPTHPTGHEGSFREDLGRRLSAWARSRGAREIATFGEDQVFSIGLSP